MIKFNIFTKHYLKKAYITAVCCTPMVRSPIKFQKKSFKFRKLLSQKGHLNTRDCIFIGLRTFLTITKRNSESCFDIGFYWLRLV
jgi:hypothetical protein